MGGSHGTENFSSCCEVLAFLWPCMKQSGHTSSLQWFTDVSFSPVLLWWVHVNYFLITPWSPGFACSAPHLLVGVETVIWLFPVLWGPCCVFLSSSALSEQGWDARYPFYSAVTQDVAVTDYGEMSGFKVQRVQMLLGNSINLLFYSLYPFSLISVTEKYSCAREPAGHWEKGWVSEGPILQSSSLCVKDSPEHSKIPLLKRTSQVEKLSCMLLLFALECPMGLCLCSSGMVL